MSRRHVQEALRASVTTSYAAEVLHGSESREHIAEVSHASMTHIIEVLYGNSRVSHRWGHVSGRLAECAEGRLQSS